MDLFYLLYYYIIVIIIISITYLMGIWGLGIGEWGLGPITNPQTSITNIDKGFTL